jgi:hypothetical protein
LETLSYFLIFTDSVNDVKQPTAPINETHAKNEWIEDDEVASTSRERHMVMKREDSIDIKDERLTSDEEDCSPDLVSSYT